MNYLLNIFSPFRIFEINKTHLYFNFYVINDGIEFCGLCNCVTPTNLRKLGAAQ